MLGKSLLIFLAFVLIAAIEFPGLIKKKHWRDLVVLNIFLVIGLVITIMHQVFRLGFYAVTDWFIKVIGLV